MCTIGRYIYTYKQTIDDVISQSRCFVKLQFTCVLFWPVEISTGYACGLVVLSCHCVLLAAMHFLELLLTFNASERITADEALSHSYCAELSRVNADSCWAVCFTNEVSFLCVYLSKNQSLCNVDTVNFTVKHLGSHWMISVYWVAEGLKSKLVWGWENLFFRGYVCNYYCGSQCH